MKPHLTRRFKLSNNPLFEEKVTDIVGLYLDLAKRAVVLCCGRETSDPGA